MENRKAILRSLAWHAVLGYPPTFSEVQMHAEADICREDVDRLMVEGLVTEHRGRLVLRGEEAAINELERRERAFPRKWQKIQRLAKVLRWVPTIRWFAVCNTTAVGNARDTSDIDLFFVTYPHTAWVTRTMLAGLARLVGRRPGERDAERDAWCFSFFVTDQALSFKTFAKQPQDPYLAWWALRLLPLLDDGVGQELWAAQSWMWNTRPQARPWVSWYDLPRRPLRARGIWKRIDRWCMVFLRRFGSKQLQVAANLGGSDVVLTEQIIKTHLDDRRVWFREQYESRCQMLGVAPYMDTR